MAGRPPDELARQFAADTFTLTTHELAGKYGINESTIRNWWLFCKRNLELMVNYGVPAITFVNKKDAPGLMDDKGKRYEALFGDSEVALMTHRRRGNLADAGRVRQVCEAMERRRNLPGSGNAS